MKYKIKEINCKEFSFDKVQLNNGIVYNLKYNNDSLEFQTPKLFIESIIKNNESEYIILKMSSTQASKTFWSKINEFEKYFSEKFNNVIKSIFNDEFITLKIPFRYSKPLIKIYKESSLFNYYHLENGMEVICLVSLDKLWINNFNEPSYNLNVKEIMII